MLNELRYQSKVYILNRNEMNSGNLSALMNLMGQPGPTHGVRVNPMEELEKERNSKIIVINHDIVKSGLISFLDNQQELSRVDALNFIRTLKGVPSDKTLEIILNTPGGCMTAAEVMVNAILNHKGKVIVYIPQYAMSAGLIIALAADEIYLDKNAFMGPADPQFRFGLSAATLLDYAKEIKDVPGSWVSDLTRLVKGEAEKAMKWTMEIIFRIYAAKQRKLDPDAIGMLFSGKHIHQRPLFFQDLVKVIPFLKEGVPAEINRVFDFYSTK